MASPRSALFVIDIQNDMAACPETQIPHAARIREVGDKILSTARGLDTKSVIVFVQHEEKPEDGPLVKESEPWKLVFNPNQNAKEEILVAKTTRDTFKSNPELADKLKADGITNIVAFGMQSECCVQETCKGALAAGFQVTILQGAHSTYDTKEHSALEIETQVEGLLKNLGATVVPWQDALQSWKAKELVC